ALGATANKLHDEISGMNDFEEPAEDSFEPQAVYGALTILGAAPARKKASAAKKRASGPKKPSSNELALELLKTKAGESNVSYCERGRVLKISGVSAVRVHVLGPPRTLELLKKDLPTKIRGAEKGHGAYKEVYLSGGAGAMALGLSPALGLDVQAGSALLPE